MNLNLINLDCTQWDKATWQEAYALYCKSNMFGAKTKKEYYDFVMANHQKRIAREQALSPDLSQKWLSGWRNAWRWAKKHDCDINGESLEMAKIKNRNTDALAVAERAEEIAVDTMLKVETMERR